MLYLLQDSYKDNNGYHDILKIGYSKGNFEKTRKHHYDTHNYGYKLLGEREGGRDLEIYLHKRYDTLRLNGEWFHWSQDIIDDFWNTKGYLITKEEYFEHIRRYILRNIIQPISNLKKEHLNDLLEKLKETYNSGLISYQEKSFDENFLKEKIVGIWENLQNFEISYWMNIDMVIYSDLVVSLEMKNLISNTKIVYSKFLKETMINKLFDLVNQKFQYTKDTILSWKSSPTIDSRITVLDGINAKMILYNYSDSYTTISDITNEPVEYSLLYLAEKRASEIYGIKLITSQ